MQRRYFSILLAAAFSIQLMAGCKIVTGTMPCLKLQGQSEWPFMVCLPDGYDDTDACYPVLYLLHGGGSQASDWTGKTRLCQIVDSLVAAGKAEPMVIVCPEADLDGRVLWFDEPQWRYEEYFFDELVPYVESRYRIDSSRGMRSIAGLSMGGEATLTYGLRHPEMFAVAYAMSGYLRSQPLKFVDDLPYGQMMQDNVDRNNPIRIVQDGTDQDVARWRQVNWFVDCGDKDFALESSMDFVRALRQRQVLYEMRVSHGRHDWAYWQQSLAQALVYVSDVIRDYLPNPMLWADVPDPDIIRVDGYYYMVSTTMHLMPGAPVMRSDDMANWQTIGYIYDRLTDSPKYDMQQGTVYGRGQWATSLKYHKGRFYALFAPNDSPGGDTYIYSAQDAAGPWTLVSRMRHFHDATLFFDDDDRVYVIFGTGQMVELKSDLSDVIEGSETTLFEREADERGLLEGSRMIKHDGKYYLLMISQVFEPGHYRREVCYRADDIRGPYQKKVILQADFGGFPHVGQGTIVDSEQGQWYGVIFQDRGGVGRVLTLMPCTWQDGWPMLGDNKGRIPAWMPKVRGGAKSVPHISGTDGFDSDKLGLMWQWNHNPVDAAWSLTERPGYLRLRTSTIADNLYLAPNTLTQRMQGPACSAYAVLDVSHLKDGDRAGLAAFNGDSGVLTVCRDGKRLSLSLTEQQVTLTDEHKVVADVTTSTVQVVRLKGDRVWLRIDGDFLPGRDMAMFYYSLDGENWTRLGGEYKMVFDYTRFFMGSKYALFCYATKQAGGYVDIDDFVFRVR